MRVGRGKEECVVVATSAATHHAQHFFPTNLYLQIYYIYVMYCVLNLGRPHALSRRCHHLCCWKLPVELNNGRILSLQRGDCAALWRDLVE